MIATYFEIGRMIIEDEQDGKQRAGYTNKIIARLSTDLTKEFGKDYLQRNLKYFRKFYLIYSN